jgi:Family of unknown function (DUF5989)
MREQKRLIAHARTGWFRRLLGDLFFTTQRERKWWLLPLILLVLILAGLIVFAVALGPLAPFIYPLL